MSLTGVSGHAGVLDSLGNLGESAQTLPAAVPLSAAARRLAAAGETPESWAELAAVLAAQLGLANATKMGEEVEPAACAWVLNGTAATAGGGGGKAAAGGR